MTSPTEYINNLPEGRKVAIQRLRKEILKNLPKGFKEVMYSGIIGYVVPHSLYPDGYHCDPKQPLPFLGIASQKNFVAVYHMGIYADKKLLEWFIREYPRYTKSRLDMGKSCIRFKKPDEIPYSLIGELSAKLTPAEWIEIYEKTMKK